MVVTVKSVAHAAVNVQGIIYRVLNHARESHRLVALSALTS